MVVCDRRKKVYGGKLKGGVEGRMGGLVEGVVLGCV